MKRKPFLLLAGLLPATAMAALAPEPAVAPVEMFGTSVYLTPGLKVDVSQNSNIYTEPAPLEDASSAFTVNPYLTARIGDDEEFSELQASVSGGMVSEDSADNFTDYLFSYDGNYMLAGNAQLSATLRTRQEHEDRGTGNSERCSNNLPLPPFLVACPGGPDVYQDVDGSVAVTLGSQESRGRLTFGLDALGRRYTSNGATTAGLEYDKQGALLKFAWAVTGKTKAVVEMTQAKYEYLMGALALDSTDREYLVGAEWDVTGKTSGYALAGVQEKDFSAAIRKDLSEPAWRVGVNWLPDQRSLVNLELASRLDESSVAGTTAKESTSWKLRAMRQVNDRVEPYVKLSFTNTDYKGIARSDDAKEFGIGVDYKFRRWVVLGASWTRAEEEASVAAAGVDFERDVFALTADMTL